MARKTLERLTFSYLKAVSAAEEAFMVASSFYTYRNRIALAGAEEALDNARMDLAEALGSSDIQQYLQGLQQVAGKGLILADE